MADAQVRCSVVIPCLDAAETLGRQLRALAAQGAPVRFEVLVCDNGSSDGSRAVCAEHPDLVRVIDAAEARGINVARNAGVRAARGELVLLCDADDEVHPGWIAAYWRAYEAGGVLMGGVLRRTTAAGAELGWQRGLNDDLGFLPWPTGANCGFARRVVDEVGPFDDSLRGGGDETEFFWRAQLAGHALRFVPDAGIDYVARPDARGTLRQSIAYGRSHAVLLARFRGAGMPRTSVRTSAVIWLRMLRSAVRTRFDVPSRTGLLRYSGVLWGRARGAVELRSHG